MIVHLAFIRLICHLPQLQQCRTGKGFNKKHVNQKCNTVAPQSHKRQSKKKLSLQWHFSNRCGSNASKKHPFVEHDQKRGSASRMPFFHSKQRKKRKKMARWVIGRDLAHSCNTQTAVCVTRTVKCLKKIHNKEIKRNRTISCLETWAEGAERSARHSSTCRNRWRSWTKIAGCSEIRSHQVSHESWVISANFSKSVVVTMHILAPPKAQFDLDRQKGHERSKVAFYASKSTWVILSNAKGSLEGSKSSNSSVLHWHMSAVVCRCPWVGCKCPTNSSPGLHRAEAGLTFRGRSMKLMM